MSSPDISQYKDIAFYDKQPVDIYNDALDYARVALPEFSPRVGSIESAVLQANAVMTGEVVAAINRMTPGLVEVLLQLFNVERNSGTPATGSILITVMDNTGYVVPKGTRFGYLDRSNPDDPFLFAFDTIADAAVPPGQTTVTVGVSAVFQAVYPALPAGQALQLITPVAFIMSAVLSTGLSVGTAPEDDSTYFSRAIATLNSYSACMVLPGQFQQYVIKNYNDIYRAKAYSRVNASDTIAGWTPVNGYVKVYVAKVGGASVAMGALNAIDADLTAKSVAGLEFLVTNAYIDVVDIDVAIKVKSGYNGADVRDAVELALNQYIHPDYWIWDDKIYYNEVVSLIDSVEGVSRVVTLSLDGGATGVDYSFAKFGTLPLNNSNVSVAI